MVILEFVGQLILFFICWQAIMWGVRIARKSGSPSIWLDMAVNFVLAILLLVVLHTVHSVWWLAALMGCFVGAFSAQLLANRDNT